MALKIIKKRNPKKIKEKNIAIITVLGMLNGSKALYTIDKNIKSLSIQGGNYKNMLPLLIENFYKKDNYSIISIYTKEALIKQKEAIESLDFDIEKNGKLINEENFEDIFNTINEILSDEQYTEFIIDISHGFRHLPILTTISMIINNFQDSSRIKQIFFAKEVDKFKKYEIIDLKEYLEISNISFVLNTFNDNYTVAHHINSIKYNKLIVALNNFSNDIMALNLSNINKNTLPRLIEELKKVDDVSIETLSEGLKENIEKDFSLESKRYLTYFKLSKNLFEKNYILLSLSLLYESIRMFLKTHIKKDEKEIVEKIEKKFGANLYKLGDFFKNLEWKKYDDIKEIKNFISEEEYAKLKISYKKRMPNNSLIENISNIRNDLSHANSKESFLKIKEQTHKLIKHYAKSYDLSKKLNS